MFTVYSKPNCPFCDKTKALLELRALPFEVVHLDVGQEHLPEEKYISKEDLLKQIPTARTMPQIVRTTETSAFVIGGYEDLKRHLAAMH